MFVAVANGLAVLANSLFAGHAGVLSWLRWLLGSLVFLLGLVGLSAAKFARIDMVSEQVGCTHKK